jgi:hypothetical protein
VKERSKEEEQLDRRRSTPKRNRASTVLPEGTFMSYWKNNIQL